MLFNFIPGTYLSSSPPIKATAGDWPGKMENPNIPLKTLTLKLIAWLLGIVIIVIVNHKEKKDKRILLSVMIEFLT